MEIARIEVGRTTGVCTRRERIPAGIAGASVQVSFTDPVWDNLIKTVVFRGKVTKIAKFDGAVAKIPQEVIPEPRIALYFGIFGHDPDTDLQIPLIEVYIGTTEKSTDANADPGTDPELPIWAQLADRVEGIAKDVEELQQTGGAGPGTPGAPGADGGYYTPAVTQLDEDTIQFEFTPSKPDMPAVNPVTVELPAGQGSGGNVDLTGVVKSVNGQTPDKNGNVEITVSGGTAVASIEPAYDDIPKIFFGGALQQTKDEKVVPFRYISKTDDISGYAEIKAQGNSSMGYPKKNQTVKMFKDADCTEKMKANFKGWGKQNKHVYKANWIDLTHARNVVSARLWGDVVKSRDNYAELPELLKTAPNQGAVDGFPVKVYAGGVYQGRYTLNIPKDAWMANMDKDLDNHCILCGENYVSGCFRASANINESDWTDEIHDTVPASIKTRWNQVISFVMNSTDEEFRANLNQYFYVDSLIDYYLFGLASCGLDAFGKNQLYMTYDGQKWIATMYDMDSTWGLWWNGSSFVATDYDRSEYQDFKDGEGNLLYIRLENLFYEELKARWAELRSGALSIENIINRFERFTDITPADLVKEDYASTTGDGKFTGIPSKTTSTIQQIRSYAVARHAWTDEYVSALNGESGGEETPDEPVTPEVTIVSISATYSGGNVHVGTAVTALSGITVTAHYSDGSTANVTGYTLSGTIAEGSNTITVSYGGKTTTFTVTGVSVPDEPDDGIDYTLNALDGATWVNGKINQTTGAIVASNEEIVTENPVTLQSGAVYAVTNNSNGTWPGVAFFTEDNAFIHYVENNSNAFCLVDGGKLLAKVFNKDIANFDVTKFIVKPVDNSSAATEYYKFNLADIEWTLTSQGYYEHATSLTSFPIVDRVALHNIELVTFNKSASTCYSGLLLGMMMWGGRLYLSARTADMNSFTSYINEKKPYIEINPHLKPAE